MASSRNNTLEFSSGGSVIANASTDVPTGSYGAIQFLKDSTIDAITETNVTNESLLLDTFGAGTILYGQFQDVSISSGLIAVHKV